VVVVYQLVIVGEVGVVVVERHRALVGHMHHRKHQHMSIFKFDPIFYPKKNKFENISLRPPLTIIHTQAIFE
jgi:hypothetical protein